MGGAEYRCKLVLDYLLQEAAFDIYYVCRNVDPSFIPMGYKVIKVGNRFSRYGINSDMVQLIRVLKGIRPKIIYQNGGSADTGAAAFYGRQFGANLVHQICNDNSLKIFKGIRPRTRIKNWMNGFFLDYGMKNANVIIGQSEGQNNLLKRRYGRNCDFVIPLGHPLPKGKIEKSQPIKLLWISNFKYHQKQPYLFVELAKRFRDYKNVTFVMIGGSIGRKSELNDLLKVLEEVPNLSYLGQIPQAEVNDNLSKGHILINTSRYEGFPNTFVQAWMREVPVVSLNVDPNNVLERYRIGFHSKSFEQLTYDVAALIEKKKMRKEMGRRACEYAAKNHSIENMVEQLKRAFSMSYEGG